VRNRVPGGGDGVSGGDSGVDVLDAWRARVPSKEALRTSLVEVTATPQMAAECAKRRRSEHGVYLRWSAYFVRRHASGRIGETVEGRDDYPVSPCFLKQRMFVNCTICYSAWLVVEIWYLVNQ
jgi:hypothetical protein